jgi:hypothetical protein
MEVHIDVIDVYQGMGPECEHFSLCPNKCYDFQYAYGTTVVSVLIRGHLVTFGWSYTEEDTRAERDALDLAVKAAQMAQLEDYWVLVKKYGEDQANRPQESGQPRVDDGLALL